MPKAAASSATARPIRPTPIKPNIEVFEDLLKKVS
jgi:hypothetical protein